MRNVPKSRRQRAIVDLVKKEALGSQQELVRALRRHGFNLTQATLSRDFKELRIVRAPTEDGYRYVQAADAESSAPGPETGVRLRSVAAEEVTEVEANEAVVLVRTLTGRAQGVAVYIDSRRLPDALGSIAGDDTILVIPRNVRRTPRLKKELADLFGV